LKDIDGFLFILSVNELLAVKINDQNVAKLLFVAILLNIEEDPVIDVQIEKWQNSFIIVVHQLTKLKVYHTKISMNETPEINPLQSINVNSISDKFKVFREGSDLLLAIYFIRDKAMNEIV
jgi:hypothetical protein